jgi:Ala-tRNA(Pro) deacylase
MSVSVFDRVESLLRQHGIVFQVLRHEPVYTSEEAARIRGTPLASGAKALICKGDDSFVMFVVPADRKLDSHAVRRAKGWRKLRFATREEVLELTGLAPGSIPPFGSLFGLPTLCDQRLGDNEAINFNAGDHGISVSMRYTDYVQVEKPELGKFAEQKEERSVETIRCLARRSPETVRRLRHGQGRLLEQRRIHHDGR